MGKRLPAPTVPEAPGAVLVVEDSKPAAPNVVMNVPVPTPTREGSRTVAELKAMRVWCVWSGPLKKFIGTDGAEATADNLVTYSEAADMWHFLCGSYYPPHHAIALHLDASGCTSIALLDAWDEARDCIKEGADQFAMTLCSYTEKCHTNGAGETAIRILVRGKLPDQFQAPPSVIVQATGLVPLTLDRISPRPAWMGDPGSTVRETADVLAELLAPLKTHGYIDDRAAWDKLEIGEGLRKEFLEQEIARMRKEIAQ